MNQTIITEKQARQITGGRKPLVPVEYEEALKALSACVDLDEAKYWSNKADALAAWAKIYKDDQAGLEARRLKIHAYRRMGILARELQPGGYKTGCGRGARDLGPTALLVDKGLSKSQAHDANALARASLDELQPHIEKGSGINRVALQFRGRGSHSRSQRSDTWLWLTHILFTGPRLYQARSAFRSRPARDVAAEIGPGEVAAARALATELIEWLDEFEQNLPQKDSV